MKKQATIISILLVLVLLINLGAGCLGKEGEKSTERVDLTIWRVFDDDDSFDQIIKNYRTTHPHVHVDYRKMRFEEYEDELLQAFAENRGPDIFSIHNTWIQKYTPLSQPLPDTVKVVYQEERGTIQKEVVYITYTEATTSLLQFESDHVSVVNDDLVFTADDGKKRIHGFPMAVDTMVLFYNRDLLDAAGIPEPPDDWDEFQDQVKLLTVVDKDGNIIQAGAGIGTGENVERSFDILSLLMMQVGTEMTSEGGRATFDETPDNYPYKTLPGLDALRFYTDFANPTKEVYTWNTDQQNSFDAFVQGRSAFFFGYSYHISEIRSKAPKLDFAITNTPQISGGRQVNYANYWVEVVAEDTDHSDEAWDFVQFAASDDQVVHYLNETNKPTALRSLITTQLNDSDLSIFASQLLTAESWYRGDDAAVAEQAFVDLIEQAIEGVLDTEEAIETAANKVNQTL